MDLTIVSRLCRSPESLTVPVPQSSPPPPNSVLRKLVNPSLETARVLQLQPVENDRPASIFDILKVYTGIRREEISTVLIGNFVHPSPLPLPSPPSMLCWQESGKLLMGYMCRIGFRLGLFCWLFNSDVSVFRGLFVEWRRFIYWNFEVLLKWDNVSEKGWLKINNIKSYRGMIHKLWDLSRRRIDVRLWKSVVHYNK